MTADTQTPSGPHVITVTWCPECGGLGMQRCAGSITEPHAMIDCQQRRARILTDDLAVPEPDELVLAGNAEAVTLLAVSKQRLHALRQRDDFPDPIAQIAAGPIWNAADLLAWKEARDGPELRKKRVITYYAHDPNVAAAGRYAGVSKSYARKILTRAGVIT